jgi:WD40 repeat protein
MDAQFLTDSTSVVGTSANASLHFETSDGPHDVTPHAVDNTFVAVAPDGKHFATYGWGGYLEVWDSSTRQRLNYISTKQSVTSHARFIGLDDIVCVGTDGRVLRWSPARGLSTITNFGQAIRTFRVLTQGSRLIAALADGSLFLTSLDGTASRIGTQSEPAHYLQDSNDGKWLATGNRDGTVAMYDTHTWKTSILLRTSGAIRHMAISPSNAMLVIATRMGMVHIGRAQGKDDVDWNTAQITWSKLSTRPRYVSFTPSGDILMIACSDGVVWFHSIADGRWIYFPSGSADLTVVRPSHDGRFAITADSAGRLLIIDLDLVRSSFKSSLNN